MRVGGHRNGDYHILVAQNFLSNISRNGTHSDTNLRIFNAAGIPEELKLPSICSNNSATEVEEVENKTEVIQILHEEEKKVRYEKHSRPVVERRLSGLPPPPLKNNVSLPEFAPSSLQILQTAKTSTASSVSQTTPSKKASFFKRFTKMVSSDDVILRESKSVEESTSAGKLLRERRITADSESSEADRPSSPLSLTQFTFLKRLRTSLARGERSYMCSDSSSTPMAVLSHFSFLTPSHVKSHLRRSRSSIASVERIRHISQCSVEELRPYDFKDCEHVVYGHLFRRTRRGISPCPWNDKESRLHLNGLEEGSSTEVHLTFERSESMRDSSCDPSAQLDEDVEYVGETEADVYDPTSFEEIESSKKTIIRCNGFIGSTLNLSNADQLTKVAVNEKFAEKFPHVQLTYSKFKSIKKELLELARECCIDLFTLAQAFTYFERIVTKGLISKNNRKAIAGISLIIAVKLNDFSKNKVKEIIQCTEDRLRLSRKELLSMELPLCASLQFNMLPPPQHLVPHYHKLVFGGV